MHDDDIEYDRCGRMKYHPDFHPNHGKRYTEEELEYICKFCHYDDLRSLASKKGDWENG